MYNKETIQSIAEEIRSQLFFGSNRKIICMSWGLNQLSCGSQKLFSAEEGDERQFIYLRFKVNGAKFKGFVYIYYDFGMDTYFVELVDQYANFIYKIENLYVDNLTEMIDEFVESTNILKIQTQG